MSSLIAAEAAPKAAPEPDTVPDPMTAKAIQAWAKNPSNREKAQTLGARLIAHQADPDHLATLESLGAFEDAATSWAIANKRKARLLLMRLAPIILS
jgi:hypothetical protein